MRTYCNIIICACAAILLLPAGAAPTGTPDQLCAKAHTLLNPGKGQKRDRNAAIEHLKAAADGGNTEARSMLGRLLLDFCYLTYDRERGLELLREAKKNGAKSNPTLIETELTAPEPFRSSGTDLYFAQPGSRYFNDTILLPATPSKKGLPGGYGDELSMLYDYAEIRTLTQRELKELADKGNTCAGILWAHRELQQVLLSSRGKQSSPSTQKQEAAAMKLLQQAADRGYEQAAFVLASHYGASLVYTADSPEEQQRLIREAERYMRMAAEQQLQEAAAALIRNAIMRAAMCKESLPELPPEIIRQGLDYLEKRARAKEDATVQIIGQVYLWGLFTEANEAKGLKLLELTALAGEPTACRILIAYFSGEPLLGKTPPAPRPEQARYYLDLMNRLSPLWETRSFRDDPLM